MQTYPLILSSAQSARTFPTNANLFVYESGEIDGGGAGDIRIRVKPDNGAEIVLRPGQRFRLEEGARASQWLVSSYDGASAIAGAIIIGSGEFDDANTNNIVTLSDGFSNTVTVANAGEAQAIPVTLQETKINNTTAERVPVSLDPGQVFNTTESVLSYNKTFVHRSPLAVNTPVNVLPAAENVNGAILRTFRATAGSSTNVQVMLLAKATVPTSVTDGDVIFAHLTMTSVQTFEMSKGVSIPPGKGLWLWADQVESTGLRSALMTVL